jgi:hypothetical protein
MAVTLNASTSSGLVSTADTSGTIELQSNGTTGLTVASGGVTANNLTASGTFGGGVITSGTAVASTSGTSIDFTGIPSWVKRVTVMMNGVSTNGTSDVIIQIGDSGGIETTGYAGLTNRSPAGGTSTTSLSTSFNIDGGIGDATCVRRGLYSLNLIGSNAWTFGGSQAGIGSANNMCFTNGTKTTSATLDRVRITTVNGTDTFDAGTINILYEG